MNPGIYNNIQNAEYHASAGESKSGLEHMMKSPAHYRWHKENRSASTPQMVMGTAVHTLVLEPHQFNDEFIISDAVPDSDVIDLLKSDREYAVYDGKVRRGKAWEAFEADNSHKTIILQSQYDKAKSWIEDADGKEVISEANYFLACKIRDRVLANRVARGIIEHPNAVFEQSVYWVDSETGLLCKCRPDIRIIGEYNGRNNPVYDLKTTGDAAASSFSYSAKKFGYHRQAPYYLEGLAKAGELSDSFGFIAVDKTDPLMCTVFHSLDEQTLDLGREQIMNCLSQVAACQFSGDWPGYPDEFEFMNVSGTAWDENDPDYFEWQEAA